jgi:hypothetical protein
MVEAGGKMSQLFGDGFDLQSHQEVLKGLWRGSPESIERQLEEFKKISVQPGNLYEVTEALLKIMTKRPYMHVKNNLLGSLGPSYWRLGIEEGPRDQWGNSLRRPLMMSVIRRPSVLGQVVFKMYESGHGKVRETIHYLADLEGVVPYFDILFMNACAELCGEDLLRVIKDQSKERMWARIEELVRELMSEDCKLIQYCEQLARDSEGMSTMSGKTNTVLGLYDSLVGSPKCGLQSWPRDADVYIDLGGGFATPDLIGLTDLPFVSFDVTSPREARKKGVRFRRGKSARLENTEWLTEREREVYLKKLDAQEYRSFNVFEDRFETDKNSYMITSFGFLTSNPSTGPEFSPKYTCQLGRHLKSVDVQFHGLFRVLELVALGKKVTLYCWGRPGGGRHMAIRRLMFSFQGNHLNEAKYEAREFCY